MHLLSQVTLAPPDTFLTFQTPNNGVFQEIVLAITMEDWLMGFYEDFDKTTLCVT